MNDNNIIMERRIINTVIHNLDFIKNENFCSMKDTI